MDYRKYIRAEKGRFSRFCPGIEIECLECGFTWKITKRNGA